MNKKQIENIVWHIETNRRVAGDKQVLDDVLKSLKNFLKETAQEVPVQDMKYRVIIESICENRLIGFESKQEDAQLIAKVIETLAGEENLSISHAQAILEDAKKIIPMLVTL
ncbi:hypothetical protein [Clostridium tertium]|jgi:hypothetical protein|uniref:hypothetical protein n=1 Tax=Clostridium tertium TaxID=1559 RepID=UPI0018AA6911|nr:hypothetical protein [Clostridium tertium]